MRRCVLIVLVKPTRQKEARMDVLFGLEQTMLAGVVSFFVAILAAIVYSYNLARGQRTSCVTWIVWGVVSVTAFIFHYDASENWNSRWIPLFYAIVPFWYLALVWHLYGGWNFEKRERVSLVLAFFVWVAWIATQYFEITFMAIEGPLFMIVAVDSIGVYTAIEHARTGGEHVNRWSWALTSIATGIGAFSVSNWGSAEMIYPGYLALAMPLIFITAYRHTGGYKPLVYTRKVPG